MQPREMVGRIPYAHYAFVANKVEGDLFTIKSDEVRTGLPFVLNSERPWEFTGQGTQTGIRSTVDYKDFVFWNQDGSIILSIQARNGAGRLDMHGHPIYNPGAIIEANLQTPAELEAEFISRFSQGDLLCWDSEADRLEKCAKQASSLIVAVADQTGKPIVLGAEPVKVLGPIEPGDLLVASDTPGYAIAWSQVEDGSPLVGVVIAKALEPFEGERGLVKAMILGR
jgi:hypothetical protein